MKRIILPLAVALAGATLASAHAADIEVAADETKTISSTPAEQPASANIHGSLTVTGGATLFPTTVNIGCAAGDDATVTVTGAGTRFGIGRSGDSASVVTIGAGGGSGTMVVDGGDTDIQNGGLGLGDLTIAADAVSTGETIDFLTLKSGWMRTSSLANNNAKPARILFAGGGILTGQGWGSKLTAEGAFIWESVDKSKIRIDLANYGNSVTIGDTGGLTIRGEGPVDLRCSWGDDSMNNGQISIMQAIAWEGSNDLRLNENLKLNLRCDNTLPYGKGKGGVTINHANAYIKNMANHIQHVNSLYANAGSFFGDGTLVFGAEDTDGELSGMIGGTVKVEKEGAGTLTVVGMTEAMSSVFEIKAGKMLVKDDLTIRTFTVAEGAEVEVDGAVLTVSESSDCAKVTCTNGGRVVLVTANDTETSLDGIDFGGAAELEKSGVGKLMVYSPSALPAKVTVAAGEVAFSLLGCTNTFYRWTIRATSHPGSNMKIGELGFFDDTSTWFDWPNPTYVDALQKMSRGDYYFQGGLVWGWFTQGLQYALDHVLYTAGRNVYVEFSGTVPVESDSSTWRVIGFCLPEGVDALSAFDVCAAPDGDWKPSVPTAWLLESSADGVNWTTVHELSSHDDHGTVNHGCWLSGGVFKDGNNEPPKPYFKLRNYLTRGVVAGRETFAAKLGEEAKLNVSAVEGGVALNDLALDAAGGMTLTGAKFAAQGTLEVFGLAEGALPEAITIPCQFVDCSSLDALADWQVVFAGKVRNYSAHYDPSAGQLTLLKKGLAVIVY